jgi:hypothetical protein
MWRILAKGDCLIRFITDAVDTGEQVVQLRSIQMFESFFAVDFTIKITVKTSSILILLRYKGPYLSLQWLGLGLTSVFRVSCVGVDGMQPAAVPGSASYRIYSNPPYLQGNSAQSNQTLFELKIRL